MQRSAKILILNQEGIIEFFSYERRAYESVDDGGILGEFSKRYKKKRIHAFKG